MLGRPFLASGLTIAAAVLAACACLSGCGGASDAPLPVPDPAAQVIALTSSRGSDDHYTYGQEWRLTFDRDPGAVHVVYYKSNLDVGVAGEGLTRAFLVLSSRADFSWERGGALTLEFEPLIFGQIGAPFVVGPRFPEHVGAEVEPAAVMMRGVSFHVRPPIHPVGRMISPVQMSDPLVTASDGRSWSPQVATEFDKVTLLSDSDTPYLPSQTYRVEVDMWLTASPQDLNKVHIEFATE